MRLTIELIYHVLMQNLVLWPFSASGIEYLAFWFSLFRPSGFGLKALPQYEVEKAKVQKQLLLSNFFCQGVINSLLSVRFM